MNMASLRRGFSRVIGSGVLQSKRSGLILGFQFAQKGHDFALPPIRVTHLREQFKVMLNLKITTTCFVSCTSEQSKVSLVVVINDGADANFNGRELSLSYLVQMAQVPLDSFKIRRKQLVTAHVGFRSCPI